MALRFAVILCLSVCVISNNMNIPLGSGSSENTCTMEMYGNDVAAYWACRAQAAHQANWFPSPIAGLFSYEIWNGYDGFWQNGAVLESFVNFVAYTNMTNKRFMSVVNGGERELYSLLEAYGPYPSFDDMGWYGLAFARIHEVTGDSTFLQDAEDIFNWAWKTGWDTSNNCSGGFWFDNLFASKQTITNVEMLHLAARLYRFTNNTDYKNKMDMIYRFIQKNHLISNETYLMSDGAYANCTPANVYGPTYNGGVMIGALAEMFKIYKNVSLTDLAYKMAIAMFKTYSNSNGVLVEYCEPNCDDDSIMYKGIFARNVRYLMDVIDDPLQHKLLQDLLNIQIESNIKFNLCDKDPISHCNISFKDGPPYFNKSGPVFSPHWAGPFTYGAPMQQTSVIDLFVAAILPTTVCKGQYCNYDPSYPPPQPLTCGSHPCPTDQDCCEYSPYTSYTCCAEGQTCNKTAGICL